MLTPMLESIASLARLDFSAQHRQPPASRVLLATVTAIAGSLAADAILVAISEAISPGTKGYVHFRFSDYAKLTVVGVIIACAAWPIVTRVSSAPRWLFFRLAILVTLVLWLPDLYILYRGAPGDAVAVLMLMHLAIALVTYNLLVRMAPVRPARRAAHRYPPGLLRTFSVFRVGPHDRDRMAGRTEPTRRIT
jgi:Family of unknown function (DUF6069)